MHSSVGDYCSVNGFTFCEFGKTKTKKQEAPSLGGNRKKVSQCRYVLGVDLGSLFQIKTT